MVLYMKGWVYFVDSAYITIETGVKPKPNCEYTREEKHKYIHTLIMYVFLISGRI